MAFDFCVCAAPESVESWPRVSAGSCLQWHLHMKIRHWENNYFHILIICIPTSAESLKLKNCLNKWYMSKIIVIIIMFSTTSRSMQEVQGFLHSCLYVRQYLSGKEIFILHPAGCHFPRCFFMFNIALPSISMHTYTLVFNTCWHPLIIYQPCGCWLWGLCSRRQLDAAYCSAFPRPEPALHCPASWSSPFWRKATAKCLSASSRLSSWADFWDAIHCHGYHIKRGVIYISCTSRCCQARRMLQRETSHNLIK